jgi:hypothetical protein
MRNANLKAGSWVIYRKQKSSRSPGPRAKSVRPAGAGENYQYMVDKFWVVVEILESSQVKLKTRRGKENLVALDDPGLRLAKWWERILYRNRFPRSELDANSNKSSS